MADRELGIRLTAEDEASEKIEAVAEAVDQLDEGAEVEVKADTKDARSSIERFADDIGDLTDDAKEVRVEFKAQQLEHDLRKILRELEDLEDPIEIQTKNAELQRTLDEIEELNRLAADVIEVDVRVDPRRTARTAGDDIDGLRQKGEGLQSAIPAIRGFGDELGGVAQKAGVFSQAGADLGDFALIAGERFAPAGSRAAAVATRLGTVLGAAGLAGAFAGIGLSIVTEVLPAIGKFISGNKELSEESKAARDSLIEQAGAVTQLTDAFDNLEETGAKGTPIAEALLEGLDEEDLAKLNSGLSDLGLTYEDLFQIVEDGEGTFAPFTETLIESDPALKAIADRLGLTSRELADAVANADDLDGLFAELGITSRRTKSQLTGTFKPLLDDVEAVEDRFDEIDLDKAVVQALEAIEVAGGPAADALADIRERFPNDSNVRIYQRLNEELERQEGAAEAAAAKQERLADAQEEAARAAERQADSIDGLIGTQQALDASYSDAVGAIGAYEAAVASGSATEQEIGELRRTAIAEIDSLAQSAVNAANQQGFLEGKTLTLAEQQAVYIESLRNSTSSNAELRAEVERLLAAYDLTPEEVSTLLSLTNGEEVVDFLETIDDTEPNPEGEVDLDGDDAEGTLVDLDEFEVSPEGEVVISTDDAEALIQDLLRPRTVDIRVNLVGLAAARGTLQSLSREARQIRLALNSFDRVNGGRD